MRYYAVKNGLNPGIYTNWAECEAQVKGVKGAVFKSFETEAEAKAYLVGNNNETTFVTDNYAFVDGSFNSKTNVYGYGGFAVLNGHRMILQGSGNDADMASMRNVSGEILGSMAAINAACEAGVNHLTIYHDYMGISNWVSGEWAANKVGTQKYRDYVRNCGINISFVHVKGHTGIEGNEMADRLAKEAVGI